MAQSDLKENGSNNFNKNNNTINNKPENNNNLNKGAETIQEKGVGFWLLMVYFFGAAVLLINLLAQIIGTLLKAFRNDDKIPDDDGIIINMNAVMEPCSFFKYIFIHPGSYDFETYNQIILHEKIHVKKMHSIDLLLSELAVVVLWFNPFIWIYRKEVEKNIEYQTDDVLTKKEEKKDYQLNLLKIATYNKPLAITTNYNQSLIKQRILKMNAKKSHPYSYWKYAFLAPLLLALVLFLNKPNVISAQAFPPATTDAITQDQKEEVTQVEKSGQEKLKEGLKENKTTAQREDNVAEQNDNMDSEEDDSSCDELEKATQARNYTKVRELLTSADLSCLENNGKTSEHLNLIKDLLRNGAKVSISDGVIKIRSTNLHINFGGGDGITTPECVALYKAAQEEDEKEVRKLLATSNLSCLTNDYDDEVSEDLGHIRDLVKYNANMEIDYDGDITLNGVEVRIYDEEKEETEVSSWNGSRIARKKNSYKNDGGNSNCKKLINAIYDGNMSEVKELLGTIDVNCVDPKPDNEEIKANGQNWRISKAPTPLMAAGRVGHVEIGKLLMEHGAEVDFMTNWGETALMAAATFGHADFVKFMLKKGADVNIISQGQGTALHCAARNGHLEIVEYLIEHKADIRAINQGQGTSLNSAARNGHTEVVKYLLAKGADIDVKNQGQGTALNAAARNGHNETVELLLAKGTDIDAQNDGQGSALNAAGRNGHSKTVKLLVAKGADINAMTQGQGTALNAAARNGHIETIKLLLELGADIDAMNDGQGTALNAAARNGHVPAVKLLLAKGADINAINQGQGTALHAAARNGHSETVKLLLEMKADVNAMNAGQGTALMGATRNSQYKTAKILLEYGADPHLSLSHQDSPVEIARKENNRRLMELFKGHEERN